MWRKAGLIAAGVWGLYFAAVACMFMLGTQWGKPEFFWGPKGHEAILAAPQVFNEPTVRAINQATNKSQVLHVLWFLGTGMIHWFFQWLNNRSRWTGIGLSSFWFWWDTITSLLAPVLSVLIFIGFWIARTGVPFDPWWMYTQIMWLILIGIFVWKDLLHLWRHYRPSRVATP